MTLLVEEETKIKQKCLQHTESVYGIVCRTVFSAHSDEVT